ncbi:hypothetical protein K438DRAFT_343027 [Mycena galopus ATCC 62051]|nr:hypothetical protein K438DRAFT_343027 [Mycena galopus ATCC 62051]
MEDESSAAPSATVEKRRRLEKDYGIKIISDRNLKLIREIRSRPGYCLHAGQNEGRAVTVKVFNPGHGPAVRQQLESTADLSKRIMHPNILRLEGVSSPESSFHFIVYEDVHWKSAEGPLAEALKSDLTRSVTLGFKMVAGLSAGMNHLCSQGVSLRSMRVDNFDIFLDVDDRFIINIHPCQQVDDNPESQEPEATWNVFNALCRKILTSANCVLHEEQITRNPEILDVVHASSIPENSPAASLLSFEPQPTSIQAEEDVTVPPRREYVWRTMDRGQQSLGTVASQLTLELDMKLRLARLPRLARSDSENPHRCVGYAREEITLTTTTLHSAVVAHDTPSPLEICSVCHEVVGHDDAFQCVCGDPDPGSRSTIRCRMCKLWSHSDCVGNVKKDFTCQLCLSPEASRLQPQDGRISQDATPTQPGPQPSTPDSDPIIFNFDDSYLSIDSISFGLQSPNMEVYSWPSQSDYPTWPSLYSRAQSDYPTRSSLQLFAELRARIDFFQKMLISA